MSQDSFGNSDLCKALFKNAVDLSQKLAELYRQTKVYADVTAPQAVLLRGQLKELCLKIMLESPCEYGSRAEDFAWRKVFYEPIQILKRFQRRSQLANDQGLATAIKIQVLSAMGFYQNLLIGLQSRYSLDLRNVIDIPVVSRPNAPQHFALVVDKETRDAANDLVYRSLVCMGNLARYQCDYLDDWNKTLPTRYYLQALMLKPDSGLPHNQLALLAGSRIVEGAYHWLLCLCAKEPFIPAKRNLLDVLGRVHKRVSTKRRISTSSMKTICNQLMAAVYQFIAFSENHRQMTDQNIESIRSLSEYAMANFDSYLKKRIDHSDQNSNGSRSQAVLVPSDLIFKVTVVFQALTFLMDKSNDKSSKQNSTLLNLTASVSIELFGIVLRFMTDRLSFRTGIDRNLTFERKVHVNVPSGQEKSSRNGDLNNRRRRRKDIPLWNEFESDDNEGEELDVLKEESGDNKGSGASGSEDDDDLSFQSGESSDLGEYESSGEDKTIFPIEQKATEKLSPFDAFSDEPWTPCLKTLCDWLISNKQFAIQNNSDDFWQQYCDLINILLPSHETVFQNMKKRNIRPDIMSHIEKANQFGEKWSQVYALPEDRAIGKFAAQSKAQNEIEMSPRKSRSRILNFDEIIHLRYAVVLSCSRSFVNEFLEYLPTTGRFVPRVNRTLQSRSPTGHSQIPNYGLSKTQFFDPEESEDESENDNQLQAQLREFDSRPEFGRLEDAKDDVEAKQRQMKAMAELWLKSEISRLEQPISSTEAPQVPIYACLVSDLFLSLQGIRLVKSLVHSQRLIVVLPNEIISHLDIEKLKNEASREASRFIEQQLRRGTPYLKIYNQSKELTQVSLPSEYGTLPAVFEVVHQLLSENVKAPSISRCLVAIVSSSALCELPLEVERYVREELHKLPNQGSCVQFRSIQSILRDLQDSQ